MRDGDRSEERRHETRRAWDLAARTYEAEFDDHVRLLRDGGVSLDPVELPFLGDLSAWCGRAIHLQCSHGLDALSLQNLGAREVVGLDASARMLDQARRKAAALDGPARFVLADVLDPPSDLDGTADLVYTGKGALPWVEDIEAWGRVVARLLKPAGRLYVFEGHPLDWVWETGQTSFVLRPDGGDYFHRGPRPDTDFPAAAVARYVPPGERVPEAVEYQWPLGQVVSAVADAGLRIVRLAEHPEAFWARFPRIPEEVARRLPHTFSLLAVRE